MPLAESRGSASGGVWGNAPTVPRATSMPNVSNKRRRQRSVPASNFARPQTRLQLALFNIYAVSRQMGATKQLVFHTESIFSASRGISPLRRRPKGNENRRTSAIALWKPSVPLRMLLDSYWKFFSLCTFRSSNKHNHIVTWECAAKGSRGRPQTFVCFHCPLVASAGAKSSAI